jgi:hypothetical protein
MNRRGFISLLVGGAGATLVPWRGLVEPLIFLPSVARGYCLCTSPWCNRIHKSSMLTQESLEDMLQRLRTYTHRVVVMPTQLIISPQVKYLIETDPNVRLAARLAGANV